MLKNTLTILLVAGTFALSSATYASDNGQPKHRVAKKKMLTPEQIERACKDSHYRDEAAYKECVDRMTATRGIKK